ncbi:3'-5' exoribonuclease YhaM family protein [Clostridium felsineum]|uniref:3'-5' exoribonuclease YhaM family protein n=1 Tax=Clostridium felsineum TaxID=36839 RepID=UPI00098C4C9F|nr:3'-5' exoribonuclease YhaM family protein [Clostridium felsineum]URZ17520.1 3'-5' exoribonuclease YhaM [Clostridium felsineum DSM 794]
MKESFLINLKDKDNIKISLMIMKIIFRETDKSICILADKTGEVKASVPGRDNLKPGMVLELKGSKNINLEVKSYKVIENYNLTDYLPTVKRPIEDIMKEMDLYTDRYVLSREGKSLNDYFFKNDEFINKFKNGIGGVSMHHNYIGGLAEHTLGVMKITAELCEKYECRRTETAVLAAKLHDIGKVYEYDCNGPFKYTMRGQMEGHIVIGVELVDGAVKEKPNFYTEDFVNRIKGCIVQHHGKLEFGSPREMNMEESFIINYADSIDATMNKISQLKEKTEPNTWSEFDRRIERKLYL